VQCVQQAPLCDAVYMQAPLCDAMFNTCTTLLYSVYYKHPCEMQCACKHPCVMQCLLQAPPRCSVCNTSTPHCVMHSLGSTPGEWCNISASSCPPLSGSSATLSWSSLCLYIQYFIVTSHVVTSLIFLTVGQISINEYKNVQYPIISIHARYPFKILKRTSGC
jgi:hypothetical protein